MEIRKNLPPAALPTIPAADMERINGLAKKELAPEEVYTFSVRLCDNEVDRDGERFTEETLKELAPMFVGKSGIFDHEWSARGQAARIYETELCREPGRKTAAGDGYCYLKAKAYVLRTEKNAELIDEIEGGIKKEVSVGCSVGAAVCSICGAAAGCCEHRKGAVYDGKLCCIELRGAKDAYEWSFVAVPAQKEAGVLKAFEGGDLKTFLRAKGAEKYLAELAALEDEAAMGRSYMKTLRREVLRLTCQAEAELDAAILAKALDKLDERELLELRRVYEKKVEQHGLPAPQLPYGGGKRAEDGDAFLI